jgi:hydroxypyruvate isomerase
MFKEYPLLDRPAAARRAGFSRMELWWPFYEPEPADSHVDKLISAIAGAGMSLSALNFFAGDLSGPDCGVVALAHRRFEFRANVPVVVEIGKRLGVTMFNALFGPRDRRLTLEAQIDLGVESLVEACHAVREIGGTVLIETLSGPKPYALRKVHEAKKVLEGVRSAGADNLGLLLDIYHASENGDGITDVVKNDHSIIRHVQIADSPGRHEPGSGSLPIGAYLRQLEDAGYSGLVGLEYAPRTATADSLEWLAFERRA